MKNAVILVRVSTSKQSTERQEAELLQVAAEKGWNVVEVIRETISGAACMEKREGLQRALELIEEKEAEILAVHEISRLARKNSTIHQSLEFIHERKASLYWHSQRLMTLDENGKINPAAAIMVAVLSEIARNEREQLRERIISGLQNAKRNGKVLGKKKGDVLSKADFLFRHQKAVNILRKHPKMSVRELSRVSEIAPGTAHKIISALRAA